MAEWEVVLTINTSDEQDAAHTASVVHRAFEAQGQGIKLISVRRHMEDETK